MYKSNVFLVLLVVVFAAYIAFLTALVASI